MRLAKFLVFFLCLAFTTSAVADCTSPSSGEGKIIYNADYSTMQFCNGTNWISMAAGAVTATAHGSNGYLQFNTSGTFNSDSALYWDNTNKRLGIGTASPATNLDVNGVIKVGTTAATCTASLAGTIRYVGGAVPWEYCDGSAWGPFKQPQCSEDGTGGCYLEATRSTSDADFTASNIASGVNILGVTGTYSGASCSPINTQTFNSSGTWTKPGSGSKVLIECWGGGGGGSTSSSCGTGGGGGYIRRLVDISTLGATETVTVGTGGGKGSAGGDSSFGSVGTAGGGGAGLYPYRCNEYKRTSGGSGDDAGGASIYNLSCPLCGDTYFAGGAGACTSGGSQRAGISILGGNGGASNVAGTAPGGGGGNYAVGANGRCVVKTYAADCISPAF